MGKTKQDEARAELRKKKEKFHRSPSGSMTRIGSIPRKEYQNLPRDVRRDPDKLEKHMRDNPRLLHQPRSRLRKTNKNFKKRKVFFMGG